MSTKKASAKERRRHALAFEAALAAGNWNPEDYPLTLRMERQSIYARTWRGRSPRWGWIKCDTWSIEIAAAGAADFLERYQTLKIRRDEKTGMVSSGLYHAPDFVARLSAIANSAWAAGIRTAEARLAQPPTGHERIEYAAEAARWHRSPPTT